MLAENGFAATVSLWSVPTVSPEPNATWAVSVLRFLFQATLLMLADTGENRSVPPAVPATKAWGERIRFAKAKSGL